VSAMKFLGSLPALLGLTGFIVYYFLLRNRGGDKITVQIVAKLRATIPERLPADPKRLNPSALAALIEGDAQLRSQVSRQDFQLLREALRQQFITSVIVYGLCVLVFLAGVGLYVYLSTRPTPVSVTAITTQSSDPDALGLATDLDPLRVSWAAAGDPEDISVLLEGMDSHRRTAVKMVRSTESRVTFVPEDYRPILESREHAGANRLRALILSARASFFSSEFSMRVGTTILAAHIDPLRVKIIGMIDNTAIPNYDFEAKLLLWAKAPHKEPAPITYGGSIRYGHNDFMLDPALKYDWGSAKLVYIGPDDRRVVRTQLLGFE
jgi:hypothetical protein